MTKVQKQEVINRPTVAYYSGWAGIEIKAVEYGINDFVIYVSGAWGNPKNYGVHRARIYSTAGGKHYFNFNGNRIHLDDCVRVNF